MDPSKIAELIFSISPEFVALLMVVFIYSLERFESFKKSDTLAQPYRWLVKLVTLSIFVDFFSSAFSYILLSGTEDSWFEWIFYAMVVSFWASLLLLLVACTIIVKETLK